jgi:hypothetical protein
MEATESEKPAHGHALSMKAIHGGKGQKQGSGKTSTKHCPNTCGLPAAEADLTGDQREALPATRRRYPQTKHTTARNARGIPAISTTTISPVARYQRTGSKPGAARRRRIRAIRLMRITTLNAGDVKRAA